jgi:hypothetical protein
LNANKKFKDETTIKTILDKVESIQAIFQSVDYKISTKYQYDDTQKEISELIQTLTQLITKE